MVYKKFIKKDGKLYGPYIYESKRVDGKVVSEYHGPKKTFNVKRYAWIFASAVLVLFLAYFLSTFNFAGLTGQAVLNTEVNYTENEPIQGNVVISLKQGELLPADSKLILENADQSYEYDLSQIVSNPTVSGNFYIEEISLSGKGEGYGIEGERQVYPPVSFVLNIYPSDNSSNDSSQTEISGEASKDNPFVYAISEGDGVQLKIGSVSASGSTISDNNVQLTVNGSEVIAETSYSEIQKGFGQEYVGNNSETINVDLSAFGLVLNNGDLMIKIVYGTDEIISASVVLESGETATDSVQISEGTIMEVTVEQAKPALLPPPTTLDNETVQIITASTVQFILTEEEKVLLTEKYGGILETKSEKVINGRLFVKHEIGTDWIENSYDANLSQSEIEAQILLERMKWLKDLVQRINASKTQVQESTVSGNFSVE